MKNDYAEKCSVVKNQPIRKKRNLIRNIKYIGAMTLMLGAYALVGNDEPKQNWDNGIIIQKNSLENKTDNSDSLQEEILKKFGNEVK